MSAKKEKITSKFTAGFFNLVYSGTTIFTGLKIKTAIVEMLNSTSYHQVTFMTDTAFTPSLTHLSPCPIFEPHSSFNPITMSQPILYFIYPLLFSITVCI